MELHNLKSEWAQVSQHLQETLPSMPSNEIQAVYQSMPHKKLIYNNLLELVLNLMGIPLVGLALIAMDSQGYLPQAFKWAVWLTTFPLLLPSVMLFRAIHQPDVAQSTLHYLKRVRRMLNFYRLYQIFANFVLCMLICVPGFLVSQGWTLTLDGVTYTGILTFPDPFFIKYLIAISILSALFSLFASSWGYAIYALFYQGRKKELDRIIQGYEELS